MHRVCCCNGCPGDCCTFWDCSPTAPINVTFRHNVEVTDTCDNGQTLTVLEGEVTITATMNYVGARDCELRRYVANNVTVDIEWTERVYDWEVPSVCDQLPPPPCVPTYCDDCICDTPQKYLAYTRTWNYTGVLAGAGPTNLASAQWYTTRVTAGAALTILCRNGVCEPECAHPVLIFTPASTCEEQPGTCYDDTADPYACIEMTETVVCGPEYTCLGEPVCSFGTQFVPYCLKPFVVFGRGCLNADSFDNPYYDTATPDQMDFPLTQWQSLDPWCLPLGYETKIGDTPTTFLPCEQLHPKLGSVPFCTPNDVTCSRRVRRTFQWSI